MGDRKIRFGINIKTLLAMILAAATLIASCVVVYARYTNSQHAQRTIAPYDMGGARFSSNYLNDGASTDNIRTLYVTGTGQTPNTTVTVSNFRQREQTHPHDGNITYNLTVQLVRYDAGTTSYVPVDAAYLSANSLTSHTVTVKKGVDGTPVTLGYPSGSTVLSTAFNNCTLTGGVTSSDSFALAFSSSFVSGELPNLYVEMIAAPTDASLPTLRGIFKPGVRAAGASNAWTGAFSDATTSTPAEYDGFNYRITGTGSGTFTLKWYGSKVELSDVSLRELLSISGATQSGNSITFPVDSDVTAQYDLQFYKADGSVWTGVTWPNMNEQLGAADSALTKPVGYFFTTN